MDHLADCDCDQCLLAQMKADDPAVRQRGWEAWYRRDAPALWAFVERRCRALGWQDHGEDILQDCFVIGFRNVSNGKYTDQDKGLSAYLAGIAKNLLREIHRSRRREPVTLGEKDAADDLGIDTDDSLFLEEVVDMIREACVQCSNVYQRVVKSIYAEGQSSDQLAGELGKSAGSVRIIAHRAVREIGYHVESRHSMRLSAEAIRACLEVL